MKSFKIDKSGDLLIQDNDLQFTDSEKDDIRQSVEVILNINVDEWFLNGNLGLNYDLLMRKDYDEMLIKNEIENAIYKELRVKEVFIDSLILNKETRIIDIAGYIVDIDENRIDLIGGINIE